MTTTKQVLVAGIIHKRDGKIVKTTVKGGLSAGFQVWGSAKR
jgi:hypothetical protein